MEHATYPEPGMLIDGEWITASSRQASAIRNPATGEQLGLLPIAGDDDIDRAADAAACAFPLWRKLTPLDRARLMQNIAAAIRGRSGELAGILTREQGKPLREAALEVNAAADTFEWMAEEGKRVYGRIVPSRFAGAEQLVLREPVGPVAAFSPWNFPAVLASRKIATALAAGCSIVIKPAEETPGIVVAIARICMEAGLPPGVLNVLFGLPAQISERLIASPHIKKLSFTGSVPVGRRLAELAGAQLKKITLELGGHSPTIVCRNIDVERVAELSVAAKFRNAGQICNCPTRFFVHEAVYDDFVERFAQRAQALALGNGLDPATQMGPLANARRVAAMRELTTDACERGARLVCGGAAPPDAGQGNFWQPTVIAQPPASARALREEPFGPFALMIPFSDVEQAVAAANQVEHGLASYAFTDSVKEAKLIQDRIEAGTLSINTYAITPPELPYGGIKSSGSGVEMGSEGLLDHFNIKSVIRATHY